MSKIPPAGRLALPLLLFVALALAAYAPAPARSGRAPVAADTSAWENLEILPDSLSRDELTAIMRGFAGALGVRCNHCHVREGEDFDFASDANPHKEIAREMMRMTWAINADFLDDVEGLHNPPDLDAGLAGYRVTCWTCHRGEASPAVRPPPEEEAPPAQQEHPHEEGHEHGDGHEHGHND